LTEAEPGWLVTGDEKMQTAAWIGHILLFHKALKT